jgi:rfaE bifunctional protein nucleotidyltransferase chain/domain
LILALNTDSSVRRLKGPSRPLLAEMERVEMALALEAVDAVTLFDEDTPRELIAAVLPDILIKGADWAHFIAGREEVEAAGGKVLALALEPGYSTTGIVEEILARP